jgi:hypothetical protein
MGLALSKIGICRTIKKRNNYIVFSAVYFIDFSLFPDADSFKSPLNDFNLFFGK